MGKRELKFKQPKLKFRRKKAVFVDESVKQRIVRSVTDADVKRLERVATKPSKEMEEVWDMNALKSELKDMRGYHKILFNSLKSRFSEKFAEAFFVSWYMKKDPFRLFEELEPEEKDKATAKTENERPYKTKEELEAYKAKIKEIREKRKKKRDSTHSSMLF